MVELEPPTDTTHLKVMPAECCPIATSGDAQTEVAGSRTTQAQRTVSPHRSR